MRHKVPKMLVCPFCKSEEVIILNNFIARILLKFEKLSFQCKKCGRRWSEKP